MKNKVSVILTTFNRPRMVMETIGSYEVDEYENKELIVVDSSNERDEYIEDLCRERGYRYFYNETHLNGINIGCRNASGDFIAILHDDDWLIPGSIAERVSTFEDDTVMVYGAYFDKVRGKNTFVGAVKSCLQDVVKANTICYPSMMWRANIHNDIGYFDESILYQNDYDWIIRIFKAYPAQIRLTYSPCYIRRVHQDRDTNRCSKDEYRTERAKILKKHDLRDTRND